MTSSTTKFRWLLREVDARVGERADVTELLSVSQYRGVVPRSELTDAEPRADDLSKYKSCRAGDVVLNRMSAYQGAVGVSKLDGMVSPDYAVLRPALTVSGRYMAYTMRSSWFVGQMTERLRGIGAPGSGSVRTPRVNVEDLGDIPVFAPTPDEQRQIADFLDDQVARIDKIIEAKRHQRELLAGLVAAEALWMMRGADIGGERADSGMDWLGPVPSDWNVVTVNSAFDVLLGKMLDESKMTGVNPVPYLRNTNVQWDFIDTEDLKVMDIAPEERTRFGLVRGDLLICEGGQPGRAAVWDGSLTPIAFQKALHRARPRLGNDVRWLLNFLRAAVFMNVFEVQGGQTTIGHLTNEQLRSQRMPLPPPIVQGNLLRSFEQRRSEVASTQRHLSQSLTLVAELKQSLISAAVSGEFDVSAASGRGVPA